MDMETTANEEMPSISDNEAKKETKEMQERDEIVKMWKHMDEKLELKAKSMNLTAINVKSILHHMIKNPQVISVIMGLDQSTAVADLKLTRSKTKHLPGQGTHNDQKDANVVAVPRASRTFLDIDYESNEDEDDDYLPEQDDDASEGEAENELDATETFHDTSESALQIVTDDDVAPALHTRSKQLNTIDYEETPGFGDDVLLYTAVDDPEYVEFISNLNDPSKYEIDEAEDPEYNFLADADAEDIAEEYEVRKDRATEIPLREVENLLQDLMDARLLPSPEHLEQTIESVKDENKECHSVPLDEPKPKTKKAEAKEPEILAEHIRPTVVLLDATLEDFRKVSAGSSSLLNASVANPPHFTFFEVQQIVAQLEKHVQLLTQFVVNCYFEKEMTETCNNFQCMINELNDYYLKRPEHSLFNIANLEASIETCHDAIKCEVVADFVTRSKKRGKLQFPLPQAMFVLSRSKALPFPELLPKVRMKAWRSPYPYFIREEECLLALGLYQFGHVKYANEKQSRYELMRHHILPNKLPSQIRMHLKNFRRSKQPVHTLFTKAEKETINMIFPLDGRSTAHSGPPYSWPEHLQPKWLQVLIQKQQDGLNSEDYVMDGISFQEIDDEVDNVPPNRGDSPVVWILPENLAAGDDVGENIFDKFVTSTPIPSITDSSLTEVDSSMNEAGSSANSSICNDIETGEVPPSPVRNLLLFASGAVCSEENKSSPVSSYESAMSVACGTTESPAKNNAVKPIKHAPFKQNPPVAANSTLDESQESIDLDRSESETDNGKERNMESDDSEGDTISDSSVSSNSGSPGQLQRSSNSSVSSNSGSSGHLERLSNSSVSNNSGSSGQPEQSQESVCSDDSQDSLLSGADPQCSWESDIETQEEDIKMDQGSSASDEVSGIVTEETGDLSPNAEVAGDEEHQRSRVHRSVSRESYSSPNSDPDASCVISDCSSPVYKLYREHTVVSNETWIPKTPCAEDTECYSPVRWRPTSALYYGRTPCMEDKSVQCDTVVVRPSRVTRAVQCNETDFAKDSEEVGGTKQEQNKQAISSNGSQSTGNSGDDGQQQSDSTDSNKSSLPGDQEDDGSGGEKESGTVTGEKRRKRTRKERLKDGLRGMVDAQHRARQLKCMVRAVFNDYRQRMFMHQDKVRALCELIAEESLSPEMFEKMQDVLDEEHEPLYILLSFLFPQHLLPASVLGNPLRKAYGDALEMIYNIEAFTSFGNSKTSARAVFRGVRDLGVNCTAESLGIRLSELIGNEDPLWEVISRNLPAHPCQSDYTRADYEFVELDIWKDDQAPFENVDLTLAIGAETVKLRSGVFVGFLRSTYTERKGKLYEVVAEWKPTKNTPPAECESKPPLRRPPARRARKRKYTKSKKTKAMDAPADRKEVLDNTRPCDERKDELSVIPSKRSATTLRFIRKRPIQSPLASETRRKRMRPGIVAAAAAQVTVVAAASSGIRSVRIERSTNPNKDKECGNWDKNKEDDAGSDSDIKFAEEYKNVKAEQVLNPENNDTAESRRNSFPLMSNQKRKWTIDEDRKILYSYKEFGPDIESAVTKLHSELPRIATDELRQRLSFLLNFMQRIEGDSGTQKF